MAYKDGSGASVWSGLRTDAFGVTGSIELVITAPREGVHVPSSAVTIGYTVSIADGVGEADLQFEVASDAAFATLVSAISPTRMGDGEHTVVASALPTGVPLYLRGRAAPTGTTTWGPWVGQPWVSTSGSVPHNLSAGTATASSTYDTNLTAAKAFNGTIGGTPDYWRSNFNSLPATLQIDAGAPIQCAAYQIAPQTLLDNTTALELPTEWALWGSNDAVTWDVLHARTAVVWTFVTPQRFELDNIVTYRYYRLTVATANGSTYVSISELSLYPAGTPGLVPISFIVELNAARAANYINENIGIDADARYAGGIEAVNVNVGINPALIYVGGLEYAVGNAGFIRVPDSRATDYAYEGDVSDNAPTPHLWFFWRDSGLVGDTVYAFGSGFGAIDASAYLGQLIAEAGIVYVGGVATIWPGGAKSMEIVDWSTKAAETHAYDATRMVYPGTDIAPPRVDTQCDIIEFTVPDGMSPITVPSIRTLYVATHPPAEAARRSNKLGWLMYPTAPKAAANIVRAVHARAEVRLDIIGSAGGIEQLFFHETLTPYVIEAGRPQRPAAFTVSSTVGAQLGTWDTETDLSLARSVDLGCSYRWLPDEGDLVPRPDLGTSAVVWVPAVGTGAPFWAPPAPPYESNFDAGSKDEWIGTGGVVTWDAHPPKLVLDGRVKAVTYARVVHDLEVGVQYRLTVNVTNTRGWVALGVSGMKPSAYSAPATGVPTERTYLFTATSITHQIQVLIKSATGSSALPWYTLNSADVKTTGRAVSIYHTRDHPEGPGWVLQLDSAPYVDPNYLIRSRMGWLTKPAMVFPGDAFGALSQALPVDSVFTFAMAAVLHPGASAAAVLLSVFRDTFNAGLDDWEVLTEGEKMNMEAGTRLGNLSLENYQERPVIIVVSHGLQNSELLLVDGRSSSFRTYSPPPPSAAHEVYLARRWDPVKPAFSTFEALDIAWWNTYASTDEQWAIANKLDGIYGVTG